MDKDYIMASSRIDLDSCVKDMDQTTLSKKKVILQKQVSLKKTKCRYGILEILIKVYFQEKEYIEDYIDEKME